MFSLLSSFPSASAHKHLFDGKGKKKKRNREKKEEEEGGEKYDSPRVLKRGRRGVKEGGVLSGNQSISFLIKG